MVLVYMLTWLGYIDGIHGTPYIAAPWIRHGLWIIPSKFPCLTHQDDRLGPEIDRLAPRSSIDQLKMLTMRMLHNTPALAAGRTWPWLAMIGPWLAHDWPWYAMMALYKLCSFEETPALCCAAKRLLKSGCSIWKVIGDAHSQEESLKSLCYEFGLPSIPVYTYFAFAMFPRVAIDICYLQKKIQSALCKWIKHIQNMIQNQ